MVKIIAVCGAGLGSSFACQMAIERRPGQQLRLPDGY